MDKKKFREIFSFSAKEKRGLAVLFMIIIIMLTTRIFLPLYYDRNEGLEYSAYYEQLENFRKSLSQIEINKKKTTISKKRKNNWYFQSEQNIHKDGKIEKYHNRDYAENVRLNINSADTEQLKKIRGIGNVLSSRIVKYREMLGGYYNLNQINEVYGINEQLTDSLKKFFVIDSNDLKKMNINSVTEEELIRHPYINEYQAKAIIRYRDFRGTIERTEELYNNHLITEETYKRIIPYLSIN